MRRHRIPWRGHLRMITALIILTATASLASACAGGDDSRATRGPARTTKPSAAPTTLATTGGSDPATAALAAYQRFWKVWVAANDPPNPDDPEIADVETGHQLTGTIQAIQDKRALGEVVRLPPHSRYRHNATVQIASNGTVAAVSDCAVDDSILSNAATGQIIDNQIETQMIAATMTLTPQGWKVLDTRYLKTWPGVVSCSGA
jgi:hypothetical protein